ncbi:MAG: serine hydrolase domain-containing protein [Gemmatimonadales bacterium]|jgi:CubicO group peptidase (beta-lactamase class C family)
MMSLFARPPIPFTVLGLALGALAATSGADAQESQKAQLPSQVDEIFAEWDRTDSPGCALGVIKDGRFVYRRGYGMANLELGVALSPESVFYIGSTSKQFVAASIMLAAEQGHLSLDDDIRTYVPEIPDYGATITVRHLLHHTSGLRDYLTLWSLAGENIEDIHTQEDALQMIARQRALNFEPGDEYLYSNSGYFLLSVILQRATGKSLREFAAENIFQPLGMTHTHFHDDYTHIVENRVLGHLKRPDGSIALNTSNFAQVGSGGLYTSVDDLLYWDRNFYDNQLGKGRLIEAMLVRGILNSGDTLNYAAALQIGEYRGLRTIEHGGALGGYRAQLLRFPDQHFSVACLCNLAPMNPTALAYRVADLYLADQLEPASESEAAEREAGPETERQARPAFQPGAAQLAVYAGSYYSEELDATWDLVVKQDSLYLIGIADPFAAVAPDEFRLGGLALHFERDAQGRVVGLSVDAGRVREIAFVRERD